MAFRVMCVYETVLSNSLLHVVQKCQMVMLIVLLNIDRESFALQTLVSVLVLILSRKLTLTRCCQYF